MEYEPEYSEGEILVGYRNMVEPRENFPQHFVPIFFEGAEYVGPWIYGEDVFIYRVPVGQEDYACSELLKQDEFVDWTGKRDFKQEIFWNLAKKIGEVLKDLNPRDPEVNKKLEAIVNCAKDLQDPI